MPDQQTVDALIRERATSDPAKPMVIDPDTRISYGELDAGTRTIAAGFIEAGVGKGTRVGLLMPNSCDWVREVMTPGGNEIHAANQDARSRTGRAGQPLPGPSPDEMCSETGNAK